MRPANIVTAIADVLAGYAIAFSHYREFDISNLALIVATICLYGGGVVLNDAFDAGLDAIERPERPIPSLEVSVASAKMLGFLLLIAGCSAAWYNHNTSGLIATAIAILAVTYNAYSKNNSLIGPINMGLCRGGNLLLGISANSEKITNWGHLAIISIIYIAAITMVSRGEVKGGNSKTLYAAGFLYLVVIFSQLYITYSAATFCTADSARCFWFFYI